MSAPALTRTYARPTQIAAPKESAIDCLIMALWESRRDGLELLAWLAIFIPVLLFICALGD